MCVVVEYEPLAVEPYDGLAIHKSLDLPPFTTFVNSFRNFGNSKLLGITFAYDVSRKCNDARSNERSKVRFSPTILYELYNGACKRFGLSRY